MGFQDQI